MSSKIYIIHMICICINKNLSTLLDKCLRKNIKKKKRDGKVGKHRLNEMGALNMKLK